MDIIDKLCNTLEYMDKSKDFNESASVMHIVEAIDMITELRAQLTKPAQIPSEVKTYIERLESALNEAIRLRVRLYRNSDLEGDTDKLKDEAVANKDSYAKQFVQSIASKPDCLKD